MISRNIHDYTGWEDVAYRLQRSKDPECDKYLYWGFDEDGIIQLCHRELAYTHCQFVGGTRSGKTSDGLLAFLVQEVWRKKTRVWYIDPKGDAGAYGTLKSECERVGLPFQAITLESGRASDSFFPLRQKCWLKISPEERVQMLMASCALEESHGDSGPAYWSIVNERLFRGVLKIAPNARTFAELDEIAQRENTRDLCKMSKRDFDNAGAAMAHLARLAQVSQLEETQAGQSTIDVDQCSRAPGVVYVRIPVSIVPIAGRALGRFLVNQIVASARMRGESPIQQVIACDEFQALVGPSFVDAIKQARDLKIAFWIAYQNLSDLEAGSRSMLDAVVGNMSVRMMFTATDTLGRKHLREASDRAVRLSSTTTRAVSENGEGGLSVSQSESSQEILEERMSSDAIAWLNANQGWAACEASPQVGLTQLKGPVFLHALHICTPEEYEKRRSVQWPNLPPEPPAAPPKTPAPPSPGPQGPQEIKRPPKPKATPKPKSPLGDYLLNLEKKQ